MKVCCITATKNRHFCIERSLGFFLEQTYTNSVQLIYNNSCIAQRLNANVSGDRVILINNCLSHATKKSYTNLGEIYNDAITYIPEDCDVVTFWDDDDIFLSNHIEEGIKGLEKGGKIAYKPQKSYYRSVQGIALVQNTLEPSMFIKKEHILQHGFGDVTSSQHYKWLDPLLQQNQLFIDPEGVSTLCYNWGDNFPTFKTSGDPDNPNNFQNYEINSQDIGDKIITPLGKKAIEKYYKQILER